MSSDYDDYYDDEDLYYNYQEESVLDLCFVPVIVQVTAVFLKLFGLCAIVGLFTQLKSDKINCVVDVVLGILCSYLFYTSSSLFIILIVFLSYVVLVLTASSGKCGVAILTNNLIFVFICELSLVDPEVWHQIRGTVILLLMKTTSAGFDLDAGVISPPTILSFCGYTLSPVSLVFGPFVTLTQYKASKHSTMTRGVLVRISQSVFMAYFTVLLSSCVLPGLSESALSTYFTAQSFRMSHYFVSYTSQVTGLIGGFQHQDQEKFNVVQPLKVEIPASMASVAVAWNLPMHYWLKTYIFKKSRSLGYFVAAFLTYAVSSVLHGLNFQLPAVLVSIFAFSYIEAVFREELAAVMSTCVKIQKCVNCEHRNKVFEAPVKLFFILLNVAQLAYLGVMFDNGPSETEGYSWMNTVSKWNDLYWYGHVICGVGFLSTFLLRIINKLRKGDKTDTVPTEKKQTKKRR